MIRKEISCVVANQSVSDSFYRIKVIFRRMFRSDVCERDFAGICHVNSNVVVFIVSSEISKCFKEGRISNIETGSKETSSRK
jgi:hypothetical protein